MAAFNFTNLDIAVRLEEVADLLEQQEANPFRVQAYRTAAETVRSWETPLVELYDADGRAGLERVPGIGKGLSESLAGLFDAGVLRRLDELASNWSPLRTLARVPGIGEVLARRIHEQLGIETLEGLEMAAYDGRLDQVPGLGPRRLKMIRELLGGMLTRPATRRRQRRRRFEDLGWGREEPPVELLLKIDARYRREAEGGRLRRIAPRRFNPQGEAWLPLMHAEAEGWLFTAMFSNTALAHELGKTHDWLIVYYERDAIEGQCTIVTDHRGATAGRRVVRGREEESRQVLETA